MNLCTTITLYLVYNYVCNSCNTFGTLIICPNILFTALPIYVTIGSHDNGISKTLLWHLFIQYILVVLIMEFYEKMWYRFYPKAKDEMKWNEMMELNKFSNMHCVRH